MGEIKINTESQDEDEIQFKSLFDSRDIVKSWEDSIKINFHKIRNEGLRVAQVGALFALKSHWIVSKETATIVMPTGTGKTETMIAIVVSELVQKTLIIVPSNLLREQTTKKFRSLGVLKENGVISGNALEPNVYNLNKIPKNKQQLEIIINESNIIVTTINILSSIDESSFNLLNEKINLLIIDEAHHIAAKTWKEVKSKLNQVISVQFTATPFRNDGKKIDGKIIFNYPLSLAKEEGYFHKINFKPVWEYDEINGDEAIADAAINQLVEDEKNNYNHIILVRAKDKKNANHLFNDLYNKKYESYNPVLIHSDLTKKVRKFV